MKTQNLVIPFRPIPSSLIAKTINIIGVIIIFLYDRNDTDSWAALFTIYGDFIAQISLTLIGKVYVCFALFAH